MVWVAVLAALLLPAVEAEATRGVPRGRDLDLAGVRDHESIDASGGIGGLLAIRERVGDGPETTRHVISDPQGNVMALADPAGTLVARFDYDPFGRLIMETGEAGSCPFRYSTKYRDPDLELYCYGHRWYDPSSMKWLTPDPIGERGGVNLTAFCANDPVNKVDPLGLDAFIVIHGITGQDIEWSKEFMDELKRDWEQLDWSSVEHANERKRFKGFQVTWNVNRDDAVPDSTLPSLFYDWSEEGLKKNREILMAEIDKALAYVKRHPHEKLHLIAHSQGTVISLDALLLLAEKDPKAKLFNGFVTMGSPLGAERNNWIDKRLGKLPATLQKADLDVSVVDPGGWLNLYNPADIVDRLNVFSKNVSWRGDLGSQFTASGMAAQNLESWGKGKGTGVFGPHSVYWSRTQAIATWLQTHDLKRTRRILNEHPEEQKEALEWIKRRERWNPFFRPLQMPAGLRF